MVMVADLLPGLKRFLAGGDFRDAALRMVTRLVMEVSSKAFPADPGAAGLARDGALRARP